MLSRYGRDTWFRVGDMDMATHVLRTRFMGPTAGFKSATVTSSGCVGCGRGDVYDAHPSTCRGAR